MRLKKIHKGTSLVVQWQRLHAPTAEGAGSKPGQATKILYNLQCSKKKKKRRLQYPGKERVLGKKLRKSE